MRTNVIIEDYSSTIERIRTIQDQKPILFVGAGISSLSGLPLASQIKSIIIKTLAQEYEFSRNLYRDRKDKWMASADPIMLETILQVLLKYHKHIEKMIAPIFRKGNPTRYHFAIAKLLMDGIVETVFTTNFDELIEKAYELMKGSREGLRVVYQENKIESGKPNLVKLHGCASDDTSIEFTLSRVGKGLEEWKASLLKQSEANPIIFIGYSDRDKDISPVLAQLNNQWIWFLYNGIPIDSHIQTDSILDRMLDKENKVVVWTDPLEVIGFRNQKETLREGKQPDFEIDWDTQLINILSTISPIEKILALTDLLRDQFSEKDDALYILKNLQALPISDLEKIKVLLNQNIIHGERWDQLDVERNLEMIDLLSANDAIPKDVKAGILRQKASFLQQKSIRLAEDAEKLYKQEEELRKELFDLPGIAWAKHNYAVTLHKQAKHDIAEPIFIESINDFRNLGELERVAQALTNYGSLLSATRRDGEALKGYEEALELYFMLGNLHWVGRCYANIALNLEKQGDVIRAQDYARKAYDYLSAAKDEHWIKLIVHLL